MSRGSDRAITENADWGPVSLWRAAWPPVALLLTVWLLLVSPIAAAAVSVLLVRVALRRRRTERSTGRRDPWRLLLALGLVTCALAVALIPGQRGLFEVTGGGTSSTTVVVDP